MNSLFGQKLVTDSGRVFVIAAEAPSPNYYFAINEADGTYKVYDAAKAKFTDGSNATFVGQRITVDKYEWEFAQVNASHAYAMRPNGGYYRIRLLQNGLPSDHAFLSAHKAGNMFMNSQDAINAAIAWRAVQLNLFPLNNGLDEHYKLQRIIHDIRLCGLSHFINRWGRLCTAYYYDTVTNELHYFFRSDRMTTVSTKDWPHTCIELYVGYDWESINNIDLSPVNYYDTIVPVDQNGKTFYYVSYSWQVAQIVFDENDAHHTSLLMDGQLYLSKEDAEAARHKLIKLVKEGAV